MSRRKAGRVPRRVDPEPDDDMEMPDLIIDVKPDLDLGSLAQGPWSARDVPMPGLFDVERRLQTASRPLGASSTCAPWMPLSSMSSGEFLPSPLLASGPLGGCLSPEDGPGTGLASPVFASNLRVSPSPPWSPHSEPGSTPPLTTRFLPADRQPWTDKHPDLLTCGRCGKIFPLGSITAFMDHKKQGCQLRQISDPISGK